MTGGRRCLQGRNFRLPGPQLRHLRLVARRGPPPPACPSFRQVSLGTPRERKHLPLDWKNLQRRLFACPTRSARSPGRLQCTKSTLRVLVAAPKGASWKLTKHDLSPEPGPRVAGGPGAGAGSARSGGRLPRESPVRGARASPG